MKIQENCSLRKFNSFAIDVAAKYFIELYSVEEIRELLSTEQFKKTNKLVLGGGSNILFTKKFDGAILKNNLSGISLEKEDQEHYYVKANAGENWHHFVLHCIEKNYSGLENLSLIPGNVGASPMQNIGAYGVELKEVFYTLDALNVQTLDIEKFNFNDCKFGYRDSVFKHEAKDNYIITSVTFRLNKKPKFNVSYGAVEQELEKMGVKVLSIKAISDAVCRIRSNKLPNPAEIGNAGSFFKNPVISNEKFNSLKKEFPEIVSYKNSETEMKIAAAWLIENCGWKGYRTNDAGVHKNQALVLVNYGNAKGQEIFELSEKILKSVQKKFRITLEREVNIV